MPDPSDRHKGFGTIRDLRHDRPLAAALGDMIVAWADAERILHDIARLLTKMEYPMIHDIFARVPTFESRVKVVRALVERWAKPTPARDAVLVAIDKLSSLSKVRNRWVHGAWVKAIGEPLTVVFDARLERGKPGHRKTVKAHDVSVHVETVHKRTWDLAQIYTNLEPR